MAHERLTLWELAGLVVCGFAFVLLRLPLYTQPGILLGWHSDAALLGLMARSIASGDVPLLFWGCDYLWPLTSLFAAGVGLVFHNVGPLALRLGVAIEVFAALLFFHAALRRSVGVRASLLATFWLCAGPAFFFKLTYAPLSAEQYFFVGGVAFWFVARTSFTRLHHWLLLGLLSGLGWWIHRGVMLVVIPALVVIALYLEKKSELVVGSIIFAAGAALGSLPVVFGRLAIDQRLYTPVTPPWSASEVLQRIADAFLSDFWLLIGADTVIAGIAVSAALAIGVKHAHISRDTALAACVVAVSFGFWIFSTLAYRGAVRYIMIVVPILYAFAASGVIRLWDRGMPKLRMASLVLAVVVTSSLFIGRIADARAVAAAQREPFENWGGFDPRPALQALHSGGYSVCYANVWVAHKLEWLSEPTVRIIPYRSVNRRITESLRLAGQPGRKCFVDTAGTVRALSVAEETEFRLDTLRLGEGRIRSAELK